MELTAKEKAEIHAKEMFLKMHGKIEDITAGMFEEDIPYLDLRYRAAKECCIIAVDEMIKEMTDLYKSHNSIDNFNRLSSWFEVKKALNKL